MPQRQNNSLPQRTTRNSSKRPSSPTTQGNPKAGKRKVLSSLSNSTISDDGNRPSLDSAADASFQPPLGIEANSDVSSAPVPRGLFSFFGHDAPATYVSATSRGPRLGFEDEEDPSADGAEGGETGADERSDFGGHRRAHSNHQRELDHTSGIRNSSRNSPELPGHHGKAHSLTSGRPDTTAEDDSSFNGDLTEDLVVRTRDDDQASARSDVSSSTSNKHNDDDKDDQSIRLSDEDLDLDDVPLPEYDNSDKDDEEARDLDLLDRGLATDPDMMRLERLRKAVRPTLRPLLRGLQVALARTMQESSRGPQLDPSTEHHMDQSSMRHKFRPYAKAVIALPRLCKFYKAAQDAVESLAREEGEINAQLERTSRVYRRTAKSALTHAMADARKDHLAHLKKISRHIEQHYNPIGLMANYIDNSVVFSDEHVMYWCLGVHFFRIYYNEEHDAKDKYYSAYEDFLDEVADQIAEGERRAGAQGFEWRKFIWDTFVEPLRKESLSLSPALIRTVTWSQPRRALNENDRHTDPKLLSKIAGTDADFRRVVSDRIKAKKARDYAPPGGDTSRPTHIRQR